MVLHRAASIERRALTVRKEERIFIDCWIFRLLVRDLVKV